MNNFDMIVISEKKENILVVMKTSEPPFGKNTISV